MARQTAADDCMVEGCEEDQSPGMKLCHQHLDMFDEYMELKDEFADRDITLDESRALGF